MKLKVLLVCIFVYSFLAGCSNTTAENKELNQYVAKELTPVFKAINESVMEANEEIYTRNMDVFLQKKKSKEEILSSLGQYKEDIKNQQKVLKQVEINKDLSEKHKKEIKTLYKNYSNLLNENIKAAEKIESKINNNEDITNSDYLITSKDMAQPIVASNANLINFLENNNLTTVKRELNIAGNNEHMDHEHMDHEHEENNEGK
ncbi:hypothetical protein [Priestia filamentosa]|uniref:hypothetical protein n=1 Tax=Priestia filamentosa TaxID=1402861 RepID=UPI002E235D46|nr:hypothetical protein [Priestia filamentosa]